jgi:2-methylcitrate dehydratase PrpD
MDSQRPSLAGIADDLGVRWEILDTGITVKLYPSCAGTHPTLDALLDLCRAHGVRAADVDAVEIGVDPIVPTILIHDRPSTGLEGKFSMPFCAAAAVVRGHVGMETFDAASLQDAAIRDMQTRVRMRVDPAIDPAATPLTQSRVTVRLRDGRVLTADANGARGYPDRPASDEELAAKFMSCAGAALPRERAGAALAALREIGIQADIAALMKMLQTS